MSVKDWYFKNLGHWSDIVDHLPRLYESAKGNVVEIGTRAGYSTSAFLAGVAERGGHLTSIDINECLSSLKHPQWTFVKADSITQGKTIADSLPEIDVLLVDGDHSYEGCLSDLQTFGKKAKKIFVHDTDAENYPGVRSAVRDFVIDTKRDLIFHPKSYGMAEIT